MKASWTKVYSGPGYPIDPKREAWWWRNARNQLDAIFMPDGDYDSMRRLMVEQFEMNMCGFHPTSSPKTLAE